MPHSTLRLSVLGVCLLGAFAAAPTPQQDRTPFHVGERLTYDAKVNSIKAGNATISIEKLEHVRGVPTFHTIFDLRGRVLFKKFANHYESWFDTTNLVTLRGLTKTDEVEKAYEFYPDRKVYIKNNDGIENASVSMPIDESSFIYYMRSLPMEVGKTYTVDRYYRAAVNPITVTVLRRERIKVPAGEFDAFVLKPVIKSNGLFSVKSDAEVWIGTDRARTLLKLRSKLPLGTLYLELRTIEQPD